MVKSLVTQVPYTDLATLLHPSGVPRQALEGFDEEFVDIVDYIIRITYRIWEMRGIERIYDYYTDDCPIHTMTGTVSGIENIVNNTRAVLTAFPDRTLWGDDVIWGGNAQEGFYSSHRITSHMTNKAASEFGAATGKRATVMTIADCKVKDNKIYEEWLVRDNLSLVRQLGFDGNEIAHLKAKENSPELRSFWQCQHDELKQKSNINQALAQPDCTWAETAYAIVQGLWCGDANAVLREYYAPQVLCHVASGRQLFGHGELIAYFNYLRGLYRELTVSCDHICEVAYDMTDSLAVALRWRISAKHQCSGKWIFILGVSHWQIINNKIVEEWTITDELAILRQVYDP